MLALRSLSAGDDVAEGLIHARGLAVDVHIASLPDPDCGHHADSLVSGTVEGFGGDFIGGVTSCPHTDPIISRNELTGPVCSSRLPVRRTLAVVAIPVEGDHGGVGVDFREAINAGHARFGSSRSGNVCRNGAGTADEQRGGKGGEGAGEFGFHVGGSMVWLCSLEPEAPSRRSSVP
jgi:hypothetical protein